MHSSHPDILIISTLTILYIASPVSLTMGQRLSQDVLRQPRQQHKSQHQSTQPQHQIQQHLSTSELLSSMPQLAQLKPQQLQQLAQLRALQIQQRQSLSRDNLSAKPSGQSFALGATDSTNDLKSKDRTGKSSSSSSSSSPGSLSDQADRHDHDGSYNEANTEQEGVSSSLDGNNESSAGQSSGQLSGTAWASTDGSDSKSSSLSSSAAGPSFEVNWNKCPQLEPSESEKNKKTQVITKCLQSAPIPVNLTRENVEAHRAQIAACALNVEGWFDEKGSYRYDKAENEIRSKKLDSQIEIQVLKFHIACKEEANKKFPRENNKLIDQVQFYQACMDYYMSIACEIEVSVDQ